jgi:phospholipid/cholesterol/gamma-HCH transport system substrate-binding protein
MRLPRTRYLVGVAFLAIVALLIGLVIQDYRQALPWQHSVAISVVTPAAGLALDPPADVKMRGVIVGEVRSVSSNGTDATVHVALFPSQVNTIPANVDVAIVPKTLFGQQYVNLILPKVQSTARVHAGTVLRPSAASVALQAVFRDLNSTLDAIQPQLLSTALNAIASALDGRGTELGDTLVKLNTYLGQLNPQLPTLVHDLRALATTSQIYAANASKLIRTFSDAELITKELLVPHRGDFDALLTTLTTTVTTAKGIFQRDGDQLVTVAGQSLPILNLLAQYSTTVQCLVHGFSVFNNVVDHVLGGEGPYLKVTIDLPSRQNKVYTAPADLANTPTSDANDNRLDDNISTWAPHCVQIPTQLKNVKDVAPLSYNFGSGASATTNSLVTPSTSAGIGGSGSKAEIALVQGLNGAPTTTPSAGGAAGSASASGSVSASGAGLADVLLGPLLKQSSVVVP